MSKKTGTVTLRRFAVAFGTPESHSNHLDAIAKLAAGFEAEVSSVFIEDADMLRAARLPFALEVCRATNMVRRVDCDEIERALKERATAARKLIEETAARTGTKWSFEVVRRQTAAAVLEIARGTDVTMFSAATATRYRDEAPAVSGRAGPATAGGAIVVLVDRSAASGRAVQVAGKLAEVRGIPLYAVVCAATRAGADRLTAQLLRSGWFDAAHIESLCAAAFSDIAAAARAHRPAAVVLPIAQLEGSVERIDEFDAAVESPILIVK